MIRKLHVSISNLSIRYKLFITYLLLISIPFCVFIAYNYSVSSHDAEEQALESSQKVMNQARASLEYKTEYIKKVMDVFALNDTVHELLNTDSNYYQDSIGNWMLDSQKFTKLFFSIQSNPDIASVQLYMNGGLAEIMETGEFLRIKNVSTADWYKELISNNNVYKWLPPNYFPQVQGNEHISLVRVIPSSQNINKIDGIIKADIPENVLSNVLDQSLITKNTSAFIINSKNEIISTSERFDLVQTSAISDTLPLLSSYIPENGLWDIKTLDNGTMLIGIQSINYSDWRLVLTIPYRDILALNLKSRNQMIFALLFIALLTFIISYPVAASATRRIRNLISHMRRVEEGNFDVQIIAGNSDEIGELIQNYNTMLTKMSILMDEKFKLGKDIKNMELKALQAQINPHFLYNTLDQINCMSLRYNVPQMELMINSLSKFYKLSLSKGEDIVTIENELAHIKAYIQIQNIRYENAVQLDINVAEELYQYRIPNITLQPLVENSILHGILEKDEENGIIKIGATLEDGKIILCIQDDGVGIPKDILSNILFNTSTNDTHGYGVRNIHERLRLYFGDEYGLTYKSEIGEGTTVEVRIPAVI